MRAASSASDDSCSYSSDTRWTQCGKLSDQRGRRAAVDALIDRRALAAEVKDSDLALRDTAVVARLRERLVLAVAAARQRGSTRVAAHR